ncbi:MAG TPA: outer membrane protein assembly factor BamD [Chitinophagales bacterium]|nr:outer membrane protein assembly factor BamD [Chitinophagales bacterium]
MKMLRQFLLLTILFSTVSITSCSEYAMVVKSDDYYLKFAKAKEYYLDKKYYQALPLFEELISFFKGTNLMQDILYYYSYCHYQTGEYLVAAYHFKNYASTYPSDPRAEECLFMSAKCYFDVSPSYMLEQSYTEQCMESIQLFVNTYPDSKFVADANKMFDACRQKMEEKAFYSADLYFRMEKYNAAAVAFDNMQRDYPESKDAELAMFMQLKSDYLYAVKSIPGKQPERYRTTITAYQTFTSRYSNSKYLDEAKTIYEASLKNLSKIKTND